MIPFEWSTAAAIVAASVWIVFVVRYHVTTRGLWRRYPEGRNIQYVSLTLIGLLLYFLSTRLLRDRPPVPVYPGQDLVALLVFVAVALAGLQRIILQRKAQRDHETHVEVEV